jgi:putative sigma-54 modulation protein
MQIKIAVRHGHLDPETHQFIEQKAQKLLHLFNRLTSIEVTVNLEKNDAAWVEFVVAAEHKHDFVARENGSDVRAAVDLVLAKLEGQLRRYKEKIQDHRRDRPLREKAEAEAEAAEGQE